MDEFNRDWPSLKRQIFTDSVWTKRMCGHGVKGIHQPEFDPDLAYRLLRKHESIRDEHPEDLIKNSRKRCLSKIEEGGTCYIIKEFRTPGPWGRLASDARCWRFNWGLKFAGIAVPEAFAWLKRPREGGVIIFQWISGLTADRELKTLLGQPDEFGVAVGKIQALVQQLYASRIVHRDMKLGNIISNEAGLYLVDNDAIHFNVTASEAHWQRNRKQLLSSGAQDMLTQVDRILGSSLSSLDA
jgi:hypothetical protein